MAIEDFEAEQALSILARADEIRADPAMLDAINTVAQKKAELAKTLTADGSERRPHADVDREGRVNF